MGLRAHPTAWAVLAIALACLLVPTNWERFPFGPIGFLLMWIPFRLLMTNRFVVRKLALGALLSTIWLPLGIDALMTRGLSGIEPYLFLVMAIPTASWLLLLGYLLWLAIQSIRLRGSLRATRLTAQRLE